MGKESNSVENLLFCNFGKYGSDHVEMVRRPPLVSGALCAPIHDSPESLLGPGFSLVARNFDLLGFEAEKLLAIKLCRARY